MGGSCLTKPPQFGVQDWDEGEISAISRGWKECRRRQVVVVNQQRLVTSPLSPLCQRASPHAQRASGRQNGRTQAGCSWSLSRAAWQVLLPWEDR